LRNQCITPKSALQALGSYCHATAIFAVKRSGKVDNHNERKPSLIDKEIERNMTVGAIVTWTIVGGIAGLLAQWLVGGVAAGCIGTVVIGILGAFAGGWLFDVLNISMGTGLVNNSITASLGAAVPLVVVRVLRGL
jgi:uncharacterized membrane protein YeaQ/YmgE (transglycosylase-associated protein family)